MDSAVQKMNHESEFPENSPATIPTQSRAFHPGLVDRLFARFSAMYGNRFFDMWANSNLDDVKKCWSDELRKFTVDQVGAAIGNLATKNFPPTLPEFLQFCEAAKAKSSIVFKTAVPRLGVKDQPDEWHDAKTRCMAQSLVEKRPNNDWASRILARLEAGEHMPADSLRMARMALQ